MSEQQVIVIQKSKTAAPIVLSLIGFILSIPGMICAGMCAAIVADASKGQHGMGLVYATILPVIANFILSFFCKSKSSKTTGLIMILLSIVLLVPEVILFSILGIAAAILFLVAGAISISNATRPA